MHERGVVDARVRWVPRVLRLLVVCASVSLVLVVVAAVLSYTTFPRYGVSSDRGTWRAVYCLRGVLRFCETVRDNDQESYDSEIDKRRRGWEMPIGSPGNSGCLGFYRHDIPLYTVEADLSDHTMYHVIMRHRQLDIPLWAPFIISAAPLLLVVRGSMRQRRQRRRLKRGLCVACGYDLTGNESGTCSECGRAVSS